MVASVEESVVMCLVLLRRGRRGCGFLLQNLDAFGEVVCCLVYPLQCQQVVVQDILQLYNLLLVFWEG